MNAKGKETAQRILAIIVIIAMLGVMGLPFSVIIFFAAVTYFIWRAVQRSENEDSRRIFEFYIHANDILRDEDRRWYGFEIANVIDRGEQVVRSMVDPPPLVHYALGALYNYAGDHEHAVEHLGFLAENELADERHRYNPSSELRRYVRILRRIEREPADAPQTMAAIRSLDRARRSRAEQMLKESRETLEARPTLEIAVEVKKTKEPDVESQAVIAEPSPIQRRQLSVSPPPPIAELLRDLYEEEKKTA
jgi:cbb3-type cytochrome oxidase subunit 3